MNLHDTRTNTTVPLEPLAPGHVSVYTCGPTVYSEPTIGNWVAYIRWDLLVRTLLASGYDVARVMNITDVGHLTSDVDEGEDKLQKGARRDGTTAWEVADRYTDSFVSGMNELRLVAPGVMSKATDHIQEQIELIARLEAGGHTYIIDDGVYFDTTTFPAYADFAHLDLAALKAGARVSVNTQKRHPSDFALWKFSPIDEQRDMEWWAPWQPPGSLSNEKNPVGKVRAGRDSLNQGGEQPTEPYIPYAEGVTEPATQYRGLCAGTWGFPGWHIECSAMAMKYLGETLDIHTGGIDHIPVHHTNEVAQSEAATGVRFANIWLHTNFLLVNGSKISKSLGNGYTLAELADKGYDALDFKLFVLQSHYRSESNFTWDNLHTAAERLANWRASACLRHQTDGTNRIDLQELATVETELVADLQDDLNSPEAIARCEGGMQLIKKFGVHGEASYLTAFVQQIDKVFGLELLTRTPDIPAAAKALLRDRQRARANREWAASDQLRDQLSAMGIGLNDGPDSVTTWHYI